MLLDKGTALVTGIAGDVLRVGTINDSLLSAIAGGVVINVPILVAAGSEVGDVFRVAAITPAVIVMYMIFL